MDELNIDAFAKKVAESIRPHLDTLEADFEKRSSELNNLLETNHNIIGTVVKSHLIVEYYLTEYLKSVFKNNQIEEANLSFFQKCSLIPTSDKSVSWLLPSLKQLNRIRNKFAHNIFAQIVFEELNEIQSIVAILRDTSHNSVERLITDYSVVCSSFMYRSSPEIIKIFTDAMKDKISK